MTTTDQRLEIAGDWLLRIQEGSLDSEELALWLQWYDADSANREAFDKMQSAFESVHALPRSERSAWASRLEKLQRPEKRPFLLWFPRQIWAPAFALILAFITGVAIWQIGRNRSIETSAFKTERATHRDISLADGSRIRLGAKSQLFVNFTSQTRYVVLEGGEAFFEVAKDKARPFLVQAGPATIRAVGTEFNVRRVKDLTIVAVSEGAVEVQQSLRRDATARAPAQTIHLAAGEQVSIGPLEPVASVKQVEPKSVNAWQAGRLEFADESLGMVIDTINRYSLRNVVITDQSVDQLRFTGTVSRERIDEWVFALPEVFPVDVRRAGNDTILISQRARQNFRFAPDVR